MGNNIREINISKKVDAIVEYLKEKNDWVWITVRNIREIVPCSPNLFRKVSDELCKHNNVAYEIVHSRGRYSIKFKFVSTLDEKIKIWLKVKKFILTEKETMYYINKLNVKDFSIINDAILIINLLALKKEGKDVNTDINSISTLISKDENDTLRFLSFLKEVEILDENLSLIEEDIQDGEDRQEVSLEEDSVLSMESIEDNTETDDGISLLVSELRSTKESFLNNADFVASIIDKKIESVLSKKEKLLENKADQMHQMLIEVTKENTNLKDKIYLLEKENEQLLQYKNNNSTYDDRLLTFFERRLENLIGTASEKIEEARRDVKITQSPLKLNALVSDLQRLMVLFAEEIKNFR